MSTATQAAPDDLAGRAPLSLNQQFLCMFDQGDEAGPFGPKYNIVYACRLTGELHVDVLRAALDDVVARHEALRTTVVRAGADSHQRILPPGPATLSVRDLSGTAPADRDRRLEDLILDVEAGAYSALDMPLLRAVLGRFDGHDAVLVLVAHHTAADEWSMQLIMRDLATAYAIRRGHAVEPFPEPRQYAQYARREQERSASAATERSRAYWRDKLRGARILAIPTHHPRSAGLPKTTAWQTFSLPAEVTARVLATARALRCSPFMVLLSAYNVFLYRTTGTTDVVVMTFTSGRADADFHDTVGSFFNFLPLRTDLAGCADFREVVARTRRTCLDAYTHDIPFTDIVTQAPELMQTAVGDDAALCAFQVFRSPFPADGEAGDVRYAPVQRRLLSQDSGVDIPDGAMWHIDLGMSGDFTGALSGSFGYNTNLFDGDRISGMIAGFGQVLTGVLADPAADIHGGQQ